MAEKTDKEKKEVPKISGVFFRGINGNREPVQVLDFLDWAQSKKLLFLEMSPTAFWEFKNEDIPNYQRIIDQYTDEEKEDYKDEIAKNQPPIIKPGTTVFSPNSEIQVEIQKLLGSDVFMQQSSFNAFWNEVQFALLSDPEYVPFDDLTGETEYLEGVGRDDNNMVAKAKALNVQVWVYSRAQGQMFDISAFTKNVVTNKDLGVGTFTIDLVPISELNLQTWGGEFANTFPLTNERGFLNESWFTKYVQNNDLIFIRFERLKAENFDEQNDGLKAADSNFIVEPSKLNGSRIWDMMGLVDNVSMQIDASNGDHSVTMVGRDYMKLFVEDGAYFIPLKYVEGSSDRWFYGGDSNTGWFKRTMITGAFDYYFANSFQKIAQVLSFVINQLSNIRIVPDDVFASCAVRTDKYPVETGDDKWKNQNQVNGIWQMIRVFIDEALEDRRIVDRSLVNPEGALMDFFNKVCQQPFVEFWGDTWRSEFDITVRQPPFTGQAIRNVVESETYISVANSDVLSLELNYDDRVYAWYRIMPQNSMMGNSQFSSLAFVPIIFFDEYCEIYGSKRCITNDIYLSEKSLRGYDMGKNLNTLSQGLLNDLLFVIETSAYLPFTRKGTITLNGDRRIKVGTFIRLETTGELYYVTAVNNRITFDNNAVDRVTQITVERGMFMDVIKGNYNYFNIIDIEGIRSEIIQRNSEINQEPLASSPSKFGVNTNVFEYFVNRTYYQQLESKIS